MKTKLCYEFHFHRCPYCVEIGWDSKHLHIHRRIDPCFHSNRRLERPSKKFEEKHWTPKSSQHDYAADFVKGTPHCVERHHTNFRWITSVYWCVYSSDMLMNPRWQQLPIVPSLNGQFSGLLLCAIGFVTDFAKLHVNRAWAWRFSQKGACSMMQRGRKDCQASWELEVIFATVWMCLSGFLGLGMNLK